MRDMTILRRPSAFLPVAMSVAALTIVLACLAAHGPAPQADEGGAAHLWQLLMGGQMPVILYFAARWLPESPRSGARILALQVAAALAAAAPVFILGW